MKREARVLLSKATDSVLLAIENFNRPWDRGRHEAVLVMIDRGFELLLKAVIIHKGGRIREPRAKQTIGFDACVRKCLSDAQVKCLTEDEAISIQILNSLRDAAQHYIVEVSEQQLYIYVQSGITLFDKLLNSTFGRKLTDYLPDRVLPISSKPPADFGNLMDLEFEDIKRLVTPGSRKRMEARAKLRAFAIIEASLSGSRSQPGESELQALVRRVNKGESWQDLFPGIQYLSLDNTGQGLSLSLRITKKDGHPIHLVPEGTPGATVVAIKRVDELGYYSLNLTALSQKVGISKPKLLAVVRELRLQGDSEYFKEFQIGSAFYKRYSPKALEKIQQELPKLNMDEVWTKNRPAHRSRIRS
jgi:hypothetical protein